MKRMISEGQKRLGVDGEWVSAQRRHLQSAQAALDRAPTALAADARD